MRCLRIIPDNPFPEFSQVTTVVSETGCCPRERGAPGSIMGGDSVFSGLLPISKVLSPGPLERRIELGLVGRTGFMSYERVAMKQGGNVTTLPIHTMICAAYALFRTILFPNCAESPQTNSTHM